MDILAAGGPDLGHADPFALTETGRHNLVVVLTVALSGNRPSLRHLNNDVGRRDIPATRPLARRWGIARIARGSHRFCPGLKRMDLITGKGRVILKFADAWIGKPRRHSALNYGVGDRLRQRLNLLIRFQGHRTYFASSMTTLTVAFENRQDVAVKRGSSDRVCREVRACGLRIADGGRGCE